MANIIVIGRIPKTLKDTQKSVVCVLQIASFTTAKNMKKNDHLNVNFRQIMSSNLKALLIAIFKNNFLNLRPISNIEENTILIIVGFIFINSSS